MEHSQLTRRSFGAALTTAALAPRLSAQPTLNKSILDGHVQDLLVGMAAIEKHNLKPEHLYNVARSHELVFDHFEELGLNRVARNMVTANPELIIVPNIDKAIPAIQATWKSYGRDMSRDQILWPIEHSTLGDRTDLARFISHEGVWALSRWTSGRLRSSAQRLRAGSTIAARVIPAQNSTVNLTYPFAGGSDAQAYTLLGAGLTVLGALWGAAPLLLPESFVCPICGLSSAIFTIGGAGMSYYGLMGGGLF